jgi:ribosomal protein L37AE/L43A
MSKEAWEGRDPHGIVPDSFKIRYDSLQEAEHELSDTDPETMLRCPECKSHNIRQKRSGIADQPREKPGDWKCNQCLAHFDEPAPPRVEVIGRQATLGEVDG